MTFLNAKLTCQNFGMELLAPESEAEDNVMRKTLSEFSSELQEFPTALFLGLSSIGNNDAYYTINSGKVLEFDLAWASNVDPDQSYECLFLEQNYNERDYSYKAAHCFSSQFRFICQDSLAARKSS